MGLVSLVSDTGGHFVLGLCLFIVSKIIWELLFSPLHRFPGPFAAKFTDVWRAAWSAKGDIDTTHLRWHRKYDATAVRIGPNAISIGDPALIRTIYSTKDPWKKVRLLVGSGMMLLTFEWTCKPWLGGLGGVYGLIHASEQHVSS